MKRTADPFDELASIYLTDPDASDPDPGTGRSTEPAPIEILMVGHLPVRAGIWLTPYADAVAREAGPTALVRLDGKEPMVQILHAPRDGVPALDECRSLRELILSVGAAIRMWIVRPSTRVTPGEVAAPIGAGSGRVARVTILMSANQVAVLGAYRLIKQFVEDTEEAGHELPEFGLALVGCDTEQAERTAASVNLTTDRYLGRSAPLRICVPMIDQTIRASMLRTFPGQTRPALSEVLSWIQRSQEPRADAEEPLLTGADVEVTGRATERGMHEIEPMPEPLSTFLAGDDGPGKAVPCARADRPECEPAAAPSVKLGPKPSLDLEPKDPVAVHEPDDGGLPVALARHVPDPALADGAHLAPLLVRCPDHERIEIAVDGGGALHVLAWEADLRGLRVVEQWTRRHRELIAMASPDHEIDPAGRLVCHLFTDDPLKVADLHATDIHLHLLTAVVIAGGRGWYGTPLSRP